MPATLSQAIPVIARVLNMRQSDPRVIEYINEAQQRLLPQGKWVGTVQRMRFCTYARCLTMPRQVETIEAYSTDGTPGSIETDWYEFLSTGPGRMDCDDTWSHVMVPRGMACAFDDIAGDNSRIFVQSDQPEDASATIILLGYDSAHKWVRTSQGGVMADGEVVAINNVGVNTTTIWQAGGLAKVIKPITVGNVGLWESDLDTGVLRPLALYEPDEEIPNYRRYFLPEVSCGTSTTNCGCNVTNTTAVCVEALAKMAFIPARLDNDFLIIGNIPAIKDMVQSIRFAENNLLPAAASYEAKAIATLQRELGSYQGDGPVVRLRVESPDTFGCGGIYDPHSDY